MARSNNSRTVGSSEPSLPYVRAVPASPDKTLHGIPMPPPPSSVEPVDAEFESAPSDAASSKRVSGEAPPSGAPPEDDGAELPPAPPPQRGLVRVEAPAGPPPMPSWLDVREPAPDATTARQLVMLTAPNSVAAQQFRSTRYRIELEPDAQIIAVASPRRGEGKSVTAANLALALAEGGRVRVLLVDASLRDPAQAKLFGVDDAEGLTSTIAARALDPRSPVVVHAVTDGLYLLPAGPRVPSAHAVLGSAAAAQTLGALRRVFRYIVVDSSPVFGSAETLAWHGMIDRYILVARRAQTTTEDLGKAADRLNRDKVLGVTFVGASEKSVAV